MNNTALIITIIGAINWLLVGLFKFDLVASIFGGQAALVSRIIYIIVGLAVHKSAFQRKNAGASKRLIKGAAMQLL